jgi:hypothetical protein
MTALDFGMAWLEGAQQNGTHEYNNGTNRQHFKP